MLPPFRLLAGRNPLRLLLCLLASSGMIAVAPHVLSLFLEDTFELSTSRIRVPLLVKPYERSEYPLEVKRLEAWERTGLKVYENVKLPRPWMNPPHQSAWSGIMLVSELNSLSPTVIAGEWRYSLPEGGSVQLVAIATRTPTCLGASRMILTDGQGNGITRENLQSLLAKCDVSSREFPQFPAPPPANHHEVQFLFHLRGEQTLAGFEPMDIRDATTGATVGRHVKNIVIGDGNGLEDYARLSFFEYFGWHPTPIVIWTSSGPLEQIRYTSYELTNDAQSVASTVLAVSEVLENTEEGIVRTTLAGSSSSTAPWPDANWDYALKMTDPPQHIRATVNYQQAGQDTAMGASDGWIRFNQKENSTGINIGHLCIRQGYPVGVKIKEIPGLPNSNRGIGNLLEARVGDITFTTQQELEMFEAGALQSRVTSNGSFGQFQFTGVGQPGLLQGQTLPVTFRDATVRDIVDSHRAALGFPHSIIVCNDRIVFAPPGAARQVYQPKLSRALNIAGDTGLLVTALAILLLLLKTFWLIRSRSVLNHVHTNGYTDFGLFQAEALYLGLGRKAWRIPPRDELGTVPGVDPQKTASIVRFLRET